MVIKLFDPHVGNNEKKNMLQVLNSHNWASGAGTGRVKQFEEEFNKYIGSKVSVAVNSGTAALHLALSLLDLKNKEVILPSLSFVSTAHAVLYNGGKPIFADIEQETLCIDPDAVRKKISKKTALILPVHFAGMPSNLTELQNLADENNLEIIEDAAHAVGSTFNGKKIGAQNFATCFSFHPVKNLAMPTGGAITLNGIKSGKLKKILFSKRWCGISNRMGVKYDVSSLGWNYYMNEFSAAIGLAQLSKLDKMNDKRKKIAKKYSKEINIENKMPFSLNCSYHIYWIQVGNRGSFMREMKEHGIETGIHYKPIHNMKFYKNNAILKNTEFISNRIVSLPIHPNLSDDNVAKIIKFTNKFS